MNITTTKGKAMDFQKGDIVKFRTGTTYYVKESPNAAGEMFVTGWKNGDLFGALRYINATKCELVGRATWHNDTWSFIPKEG